MNFVNNLMSGIGNAVGSFVSGGISSFTGGLSSLFGMGGAGGAGEASVSASRMRREASVIESEGRDAAHATTAKTDPSKTRQPVMAVDGDTAAPA